jgi:hypothetical protein
MGQADGWATMTARQQLRQQFVTVQSTIDMLRGLLQEMQERRKLLGDYDQDDD